jgi:translation initiation factor 1
MRPDPKKRIDTSGAQSPLGGLGGALDGIKLGDLPEGNAAPVPVAKPAEPLWKMGRVVLRRETAHRGGKSVVVVDDFATHLPASVIESMAKKLRGACGCGGAVKGRKIELQGDQPGKIRALLEAEGFQVAGVK